MSIRNPMSPYTETVSLDIWWDLDLLGFSPRLVHNGCQKRYPKYSYVSGNQSTTCGGPFLNQHFDAHVPDEGKIERVVDAGKRWKRFGL